MQSHYKVSAIVSTYANERFIEGCLEDLCRQTIGLQLEIIVIDSCSPENEGAIVRRFQEKYSNIVYLRTEERETLYAAWNRAIKISQGQYIINANTDDRLRIDAYEVMANVLELHQDIALVYADYLITGTENESFERHTRIGSCLRPEYSHSIMMHGCHMGPQPMWRKSVHDQVGWFDDSLKSAGDYEFWCRIAAAKLSMYHISDFLGLYLHNVTGIANSNQRVSVSEALEVQKKYVDLLPARQEPCYSENYFKGEVDAKGFVNIGIVTYNRLEYTKQVFEALVKLTDYPHVITVVDNASTDGTKEFLLKQKDRGLIRNLILLNENIGVAKASNISWLMEPEASWFLKLDNDIVMQKPKWLQEMINVVDKLPSVGVVAYNVEPVSYISRRLNKIFVRIKDKANVGGACILIPKRTLLKLGFWSEDYGIYGEEDTDYGRRVNIAGLKNVYMEDQDLAFHLPAGKAGKIDSESLEARDGLEEFKETEYRSFKDKFRKKNIESGVLNRNMTAYRKGRRSLFGFPTSAFNFIKLEYPDKAAIWSSIRFCSNHTIRVIDRYFHFFLGNGMFSKYFKLGIKVFNEGN
jgi:GT2 family glycosyltransferase